MKNEMSSYFEEPEFKKTLAKYEGMDASHAPAYFDAGELTDIADYYASNGRPDDADKVIDFALRLHPNDTDALLFRARSFAYDGNPTQAHKVIDLIEDQSDREVRFLRAYLLLQEKRIEEADRAFDRLAQDEEEELDLLLDIIQTYTAILQQDYAMRWIYRLAEQYDTPTLEEKSQPYRDVMYDYYLTFEEPEKAIPLLQTSLDKHPYSIDYWNDLADCHLKTGNIEEANEALDFALAIDDKNVEALALKSECCQLSGNRQEASRYLHRMSEESSNYTPLQLTLIRTFIEIADYESAAELISLQMDPKKDISFDERGELYSYAALCHAHNGEVEEGENLLRTALEMGGKNPNIYMSAGRFYLMTGNEHESVKYFEQAIREADEDEVPRILLSTAEACFDACRYTLAARFYMQLEMDCPEEAGESYFPLLYCSYHEKNIPSFLHYMAKIREEDPDLYDTLEEECNITCPDDKVFYELLQRTKEHIECGQIDLDFYL